MEQQGYAEARYKALARERDIYLERGRRLARLTIPAILPDEGTHGADLAKPYQGMGARGVNNISSKMLLSLFPININFWRYKIDESVYLNPEAAANRTMYEEEAAQIEKVVTDDIEVSGFRVKAYEAIRQLLVIGNTLIHLPANGDPRVFRLDSYVVDRDPTGNLIEVVTRQKIAPVLLSPKVRDAIGLTEAELMPSAHGEPRSVEIYTHCVLTEDGWVSEQSIKGKPLLGSRIDHGERLPYLALRMIAEDGSNYGRGLCEEYEGDLRLLEALSKAIAKGSLASARLLMLVDPGGRTNIKDLQRADDGDFVLGRRDDVQALQVEKFADLQVAFNQIGTLERRLANVFLINTPRDAERVTAEEVRLVALELESSLGGLFSLMSQEFQLPLVEIYLERARATGELPDLGNIARPTVTTGIDAIGRGHDAQRLQTFIGQVAQMGPEAMRYINMPVWITQLATALGIETEELIRTQEDIQAENQQAQQAQLLQGVAPKVVDKYPEAVQQAIQQMAG